MTSPGDGVSGGTGPSARVPRDSPPPGRPLPEPGTLALPEPGEVQVWWARLDPGNLTEDTRERLRADVDADRLAKLARYRLAADQDRGLVGHVLLRRVLSGLTGTPPAALDFDVHCPHCDSDEHGKPYLVRTDGGPVPEFNLSHSGPLVAVGLTADRPVGVDVEAARRVDWNSLRGSVFDDAEWQATEQTPEPDRLRTQLWSRKEAAVKASGHGLALPLRQVVVFGTPAIGEPDEPARAGTARSWSTRLPQEAGSAWGRDLDLGPDAGGAVAVHDTVPAPGQDEDDPVAQLSVLFVTI